MRTGRPLSRLPARRAIPPHWAWISTNTATIDDAAAQVHSTVQTIGSNASVLQIREDFTTDLVNTLKEGEAKLVQTDLNEEAANSLALSTRNQLASAATNLAIQSEQTILQLF